MKLIQYSELRKNYIDYINSCRDNIEVILNDFASEIINNLSKTYDDEYIKCHISYCKDSLIAKFSFRFTRNKPKNENIRIEEKKMTKKREVILFGKNTISVYRQLSPQSVSICSAIHTIGEINYKIQEAELEHINTNKQC